MRHVPCLVLCGLFALGCPAPKKECSTTADCPSGEICNASDTCEVQTPAPGPIEPTAIGTLLISDLTVQDHPELGRGARVDLSFSRLQATGALQHVDERNALGVGCVADLWNASDWAAQISLNEGAVTVTGTSGHLPPCAHVTGAGYLCIAASGMAQTTILAAADTGGLFPPGTAQLTFSGVTFTGDEIGGRTLFLSGAPHAGNNAMKSNPLPITAWGGNSNADSIVVVNPAAVSEGPFSGTYTVLGGAGPVPNGPAFLQDTDHVSVTLTKGGAGDFDSFTADGLVPGTPFHPDSASASLLTHVTVDGQAFQLSCDVAGSHCGTATTTLLILTTSDTPLTGGAPSNALPAPTNKVATVSCSALGETVQVSAAASALIQAAAPKVIQTTMVRANLTTETNAAPPSNRASIALGHAIAGFTVVP